MNDERSSFVFHCEYRKYIRMLPIDEQIAIYDFLPTFCQTSGTAQLPKMSVAANIVLMQITERMTEEFKKYDEVRAERAKGGKKGGRPKKPKGDEGNLMDPEKPYGLCENLKVSEKPEGFSEKLKNPVYGSVFGSDSDSVSVSDCVCIDNESDTHTTAITLEDVKECYEAVCKERKLTPLPGEVERWFPKYAHAFTNREVMRQKISGWVNDDVNTTEKYNRPQKTMQKRSTVNYTQSGTDWDAVTNKVQEKEMEEWKGERDELDFENE
jgi:hypothetical protein